MTQIRMLENPDSLELEASRGTIFLLAPGIEMNEIVDYGDTTVCRDLSDVRSRSESTPTVIPDFYSLFSEYLRAEKDANHVAETFFDLVSSPPYPTIFLNPREFDWLLTAENLADSLPISEYELVFVRYDIETAKRIAADRYDFEDDTDILQRLSYGYQFDSPSFSDDVLETSLPFLLPTIGRHLSEDPEGVIFPDVIDTSQAIGLRELLTSMGEEVAETTATGAAAAQLPSIRSIREALQDADIDHPTLFERLRDLAPSALGGALGAGIGSTAASVALPLVVYLFLDKRARARDEREFYDRLGTVLDNRLLPPTTTKLEEKLGLPPRTLESIHNLSRPETYRRLDRLIEEVDPDELRVFRESLSQHQDEIESIGEEIAMLDSRVERVEGIIDSAVAGSVKDLSFLEEIRIRTEAHILNRSSIDSTNLAFVGPFPQLIREAISEENLIIVTGVAGCGKSSAIYHALDGLEAEGDYVTRVPQLNTKEKEFIVRGIRSSGGRAPVIVSEFESAWGIEDRGDLRTLLSVYEELDRATLVIECRSESLDRFKGLSGGGLPIEGSAQAHLDAATTVRAPPLDASHIGECVTWMGRQLSLDVELEGTDILDSGAIASETYGLLTKLWVARMASTGRLDGGFDEIVYRTLGSFLGEYETDSDEHRIVKLLSVAGPVTPEVVRDIYNLTHTDFQTAIQRLDEYITDEESKINLRVPFLQGVLLREEFIDHILPVTRDLIENEHTDIIPRLVANLTASYEFVSERSASEVKTRNLVHRLPEEIGKVAVESYKGSSAELYFDCLDAAFGVPVSSRFLQPEPFVEWLEHLISSDIEDAEQIKKMSPVSAGLFRGEPISLMTAGLGIAIGHARSPHHPLNDFLEFLTELAEHLQRWIDRSQYAVGNFTHIGVIQDLFETSIGLAFLYPDTVDIDVEGWCGYLERTGDSLFVVKNMGRTGLPETWPIQVMGGAVGQGFLIRGSDPDMGMYGKGSPLTRIERILLNRDAANLDSYFHGLFARINKHGSESTLRPTFECLLIHWAEDYDIAPQEKPLGTIGAPYLDRLGEKTGFGHKDISVERKQAEFSYVLAQIENQSEMDQEWTNIDELFLRFVNRRAGLGMGDFEGEWLDVAAKVGTERGYSKSLFESVFVTALIKPSAMNDEDSLLLPRVWEGSRPSLRRTGPYEYFSNSHENTLSQPALDSAYICLSITSLGYPKRLSILIDKLAGGTIEIRDGKLVLEGPEGPSEFLDLSVVRESVLSWGEETLPVEVRTVVLSILFGSIAGKGTMREPFLRPCQVPSLDVERYMIVSQEVPLQTLTWLLDREGALVDIVVGAYNSGQHGVEALEGVASVLEGLFERLMDEDSVKIQVMLANRLEELAEDSPSIHDDLLQYIDTNLPSHE